jgi:hypothetical protein
MVKDKDFEKYNGLNLWGFRMAHGLWDFSDRYIEEGENLLKTLNTKNYLERTIIWITLAVKYFDCFNYSLFKKSLDLSNEIEFYLNQNNSFIKNYS